MAQDFSEGAVTNRGLLDLAVQAGRAFQSERSGYVHDEELIPVYENFLFALALLRTRTVEQVQEARQLVERLLHFQNQESLTEAEGNFPRFLHEYPRCEHRLLGTQLLAPIYLMLRHYAKALGRDLSGKLHDAFEDLLENQMQAALDVAPPAHLGVKLAAVCRAYGSWRENAQLVKYGQELWEASVAGDRLCIYSPAYLGDIIWAYELVEQGMPEELSTYLAASYHRSTASYVGPALYEFYRQGQPQVQLYDFMLANLCGQLPARALQPRLVSLQAALVFPTRAVLQEAHTRTGSYRGLNWLLKQNKDCALSLIERGEACNPAMAPGFAALRLTWSHEGEQRSLMLQGGGGEISYSLEGNTIELSVQLPSDFDPDDRNRSRELHLYFDALKPPGLTVDGIASNTFQMGQQLKFGDESCPLTLRIDACGGDFMGHLMRANRLAEREGENPGRDWCLCVRSLRREPNARLTLHLTVPALAGTQGVEHVTVATSSTGV